MNAVEGVDLDTPIRALQKLRAANPADGTATVYAGGMNFITIGAVGLFKEKSGDKRLAVTLTSTV